MAPDAYAPILMTLAGLAYAKPSFLSSYFADHTVMGTRWSLVWLPDDTPQPPVNFAYIVNDVENDRYVLAIRGTYPDPLTSAYWEDGAQDSPFGAMHDWPGDITGTAKVSAGAWIGFQSLLGLTGCGRTLAAVLKSLGGVDLCFTGHSLGGTQAPILALWAAENTAIAKLSVYAFAGMTPGNAAFAKLFEAWPRLAGRIWRYNNTLDTVPYGWNRVLGTLSFYQPAPQGGLIVQVLLLLTALRLAFYGFKPVGEEIKLKGAVLAIDIKFQLIAYVIENLHQHLPDTYLSLLGAPPLPFLIGFGSYVADRAAAPPPGPIKRHVANTLTTPSRS